VERLARPAWQRRVDVRFLAPATIAALALRLLYAGAIDAIDWPDTLTYWQAGRELWSGRTMSSTVAMPLYPLFLVGAGWRRAVAVQLVLSALLVPIAYGLAIETFRRRDVARWAAGLMAIEPLSVFYAGQRLTETLFTFLLCLALLALLRHRLGWGAFILVLSILVRPTIDLVAPALIVLFALRNAEGPKAPVAARALARYALIYALVMAPWWIHNAIKYDRFVRLNLGDGIVLRIENNPLFIRHGFWSGLAPILDEFAAEADPVRRNALRREAALGFIVDVPLRYLRLCARRVVRFWSPVIDQDENDWLPARGRTALVAATVAIYAGVAAFALQRRARRWRRVAPLLLVVGYLATVHAATHALVRYRAPLMPLVVVVAAAGWQRITRRRVGLSAPSYPRRPTPGDVSDAA
jgi:4-amino-4-deoxy-L-arabinose transferase-like glycosyltransferase